MKKSLMLGICFALIFLLFLSFASAGWLSDFLTGFVLKNKEAIKYVGAEGTCYDGTKITIKGSGEKECKVIDRAGGDSWQEPMIVSCSGSCGYIKGTKIKKCGLNKATLVPIGDPCS